MPVDDSPAGRLDGRRNRGEVSVTGRGEADGPPARSLSGRRLPERDLRTSSHRRRRGRGEGKYEYREGAT
jgi:hypothetical protein